MTALCKLLVAAALISGAGCRHLNRVFHRPQPCTFNPASTKQEIVAHVNRYVVPAGPAEPLTSWRSLSMNLSMKGMPRVGGTLDVQAPHRLRIRAEVPLSNIELADIGSNDKEIWFWGKGAESIVTVRHEDLPHALSQMQIPFEPEWLMEVLGVVPIVVDDYELIRPQVETGFVELVAQTQGPSGEPLRRVIRVDVCRGQILEHRIERLDGRRIAWARLAEYRADYSGQYVLPHFIQIDWPEAETSLTLHFTSIIANPPPVSEATWSVPDKNGLPRSTIGPGRPLSGGPPAHAQLIQAAGGMPAIERSTRFNETLPAAGPPAEYSAAASQSSWDQPPREPASAPRPFP